MAFYPGLRLHPTSAEILPINSPCFGKSLRTARRDIFFVDLKFGWGGDWQFASKRILFLQTCYRYLPIRLCHLFLPGASLGIPVWTLFDEFSGSLRLQLHHSASRKIYAQNRD